MKYGKVKQQRVKKLLEQIQDLRNKLEIEKQQREQEVLTLSATQVSLQMEITALAKFIAEHFELGAYRAEGSISHPTELGSQSIPFNQVRI